MYIIITALQVALITSENAQQETPRATYSLYRLQAFFHIILHRRMVRECHGQTDYHRYFNIEQSYVRSGHRSLLDHQMVNDLAFLSLSQAYFQYQVILRCTTLHM
jgi:hypothetical protein